jgi:hypothetical protein
VSASQQAQHGRHELPGAAFPILTVTAHNRQPAAGSAHQVRHISLDGQQEGTSANLSFAYLAAHAAGHDA